MTEQEFDEAVTVDGNLSPTNTIDTYRRRIFNTRRIAIREVRRLREENTTLAGLLQGHAEHSDRLLQEKAALQARIRELEQKPPTYDDWVAAAYVQARNQAVDSLSEDLKRHVEQLDATIAAQRGELDRLHRRLAEQNTRWMYRRDHHLMKNEANCARANRLDVLYRRWRARAERAEAKPPPWVGWGF